MYNIGDIIRYDENYIKAVQWCRENKAHIDEIEADEQGRRFKIVANEDYTILTQINELKALLSKYKEDVEQVELFGMERDDYETKKRECASIVLQLRNLEKIRK